MTFFKFLDCTLQGSGITPNFMLIVVVTVEQSVAYPVFIYLASSIFTSKLQEKYLQTLSTEP